MLGTTPAYGAYIRHCKDVKLHNEKFNLKEADVRQKIILEDVENYIEYNNK